MAFLSFQQHHTQKQNKTKQSKKRLLKKKERSWPKKYCFYSTHDSWKYCVSSGTVANAIFS